MSLAATAGVLGAVAVAGTVAWLASQVYDDASFVAIDHASRLDGIKNTHLAIMDDLDGGYGRLLAGEIGVGEYVEMANASSDRVRSLISEAKAATPRNEWRDSYRAYVEALRQYDVHVRDTVEVASAMAGSGGQEFRSIASAMESASASKTAAVDRIIQSEMARPD